MKKLLSEVHKVKAITKTSTHIFNFAAKDCLMILSKACLKMQFSTIVRLRILLLRLLLMRFQLLRLLLLKFLSLKFLFLRILLLSFFWWGSFSWGSCCWSTFGWGSCGWLWSSRSRDFNLALENFKNQVIYVDLKSCSSWLVSSL